MDTVEPSGFVPAPSQSPVNVSLDAKLETVGVAGRDVGDMGVAVGAAQADRKQSRSRVEMMRMYVSIFQPVLFITTLQRGIVILQKGGKRFRIRGQPRVGVKRNFFHREAPSIF